MISHPPGEEYRFLHMANAGSQRAARAGKTQALSSLLASLLLVSYWPKQVTWPSTDSKGKKLNSISFMTRTTVTVQRESTQWWEEFVVIFSNLPHCKMQKSLLHIVHDQISFHNSSFDTLVSVSKNWEILQQRNTVDFIYTSISQTYPI